MKAIIRHRLIRYLTKNLLKAITEDDILQITTEGYLLRKRKLTADEIQALKEEVNSFKKSILWRLMQNDVRFMASELMFSKAKTPEDIVFGKAMLYDLSLLDKYVHNILSQKR